LAAGISIPGTSNAAAAAAAAELNLSCDKAEAWHYPTAQHYKIHKMIVGF